MNHVISMHFLCISCRQHLLRSTYVLDWCISCSKHLDVLCMLILLVLIIFLSTFILLMLAYFMEVQTKFLCLDVLKIWSKLWYMYKDMPCLLHEKKKENFDL
jgi:uncharacterized membrane protein